MENNQGARMEEMGKKKLDVYKKLSQMMEIITKQIKKKEAIEMHWKNHKMDRPCLPILLHIKIPSRQPSGQEQNFGAPFVNPLMVPDLDDPYEKEKLKKGSS